MFATFANVAGGDVPDDRVIDSIDQLDFLTGRQEKSNRDGFMVYVGAELFGIKWRNWKMMFQEVERGTDERRTFDFPRFFNLYNRWLSYSRSTVHRCKWSLRSPRERRIRTSRNDENLTLSLRRQGSQVQPIAIAIGDGAALAAKPGGLKQPLGCFNQSCRARHSKEKGSDPIYENWIRPLFF
jgi:hypothetical protein